VTKSQGHRHSITYGTMLKEIGIQVPSENMLLYPSNTHSFIILSHKIP